MNNIQKSFKSKARCGLRMAVGGVIADPTDQQRTPDSDLDRLTAQSNMSAAMAGLSNTERYQLANPTNAPYKANSMMGGTSAEASMLRQRSGILASLRDRLAEQQQPTLPSLRFADGGIINTLRNRGAVIDAAVDSAGTPAPVAAPVATAPALPSQAADYAAQAAALEAEQLAAARAAAAAAPKPKQGLMSRLGFAQGGVVRLQGPGTGTSDDIPLTLRTGGEGMNINVSNGEGLAVLPAKTMQHPEAVAAVNDIIETTNGKPPRGLKAGASYAYGGVGEIIQDGVKTGTRIDPGLSRTNWINPNTQVVPYEAPPAAPAREIIQDGVKTPSATGPAKPNWTQPRNMPTNVPPEAPTYRAPINNAPVPYAAQGAGQAAADAAAIEGKTMSNARYAFDQFGRRMADVGKMTGGQVFDAAKKQVVPAIKGLARGAANSINTVANGTTAIGDVVSTVADERPKSIADRHYIGDAVGGVMRAMGGAIDQDLEKLTGRTLFNPDLEKMKRGLRTIEAAGNTAVGVASDVLPASWLGKIGLGAGNAATNFRPITSAVHHLRGDTPIESAYREKYATTYDQMPGPLETARNAVAAASTDGKTTLVARKEQADAAKKAAEGKAETQSKDNLLTRDLSYTSPTTATGGGQEVASTEPNAPPKNDIQVRSIRGANGKMQPEFYGTNVTQAYMGADGKPTTNWYETQAYKDSQVQAAKDKELLKTYEKWGLEGDLKSNNPAYQARGLARQKAFDENSRTEAAREVAAANRDLQRQELDIRREDLGLRRSQEQRAIAAASRQAQLAAAEEGRKADEATSKKQDNYHKYLESVLTMPLTDSNGNVTNVPDARAIAEFTSKADATVAAMEEATRNTAEHSRWVDPQTKKPKSAADLDDTQKSWILNRFKAYQRIKQAQKGWATLGYADKFDTNDLSLLDGAEEGDYISFPKLKAKLGFVPRIQKKDLAYSDGPIGLTDLQLGKTPYDALTNNILGR